MDWSKVSMEELGSGVLKSNQGHSCGICEHNTPIGGFTHCAKEHQGIFRLMVIGQEADCPDFDILKSIVSIKTVRLKDNQ